VRPLRRDATVPPLQRRRQCITASAITVSAPCRETDPKKRIVITGMGLVSVFGNDVDKFYDKLLEGESGIGPIDRFDASKFPTRFAGQIRGFSSEGYIDGKNDRRLDNCLRYCLVSGKKALESAGLGLGSEQHKKVTLDSYFIALIWRIEMFLLDLQRLANCIF
jgi:3-oxoacyl-[acyl-carrier-protein] synthase II